MRGIVQHARFRADVKRAKRRGWDIEDLIAVVELLTEEGVLPPGYRPHRLRGEWTGVWECHIDTDWLLIYQVTQKEVTLIRTGSHRDLFG